MFFFFLVFYDDEGLVFCFGNGVGVFWHRPHAVV